MFEDIPLWLIDGAVACFGAHLLFTAFVRWRVTKDAVLKESLFGLPLGAKGKIAFMPLLQARYFWPFSRAPRRLRNYSLFTRAMFWLARLAGSAFAFAIVLFLALVFLLDEP
jgi:hypothetical protein